MAVMILTPTRGFAYPGRSRETVAPPVLGWMIGAMLPPALRRRTWLLPLLALLMLGCSSDGTRRHICTLQKGMTADELVRCGCVPARTGGGSVMIGGRGPQAGETIMMVHYICPRGAGGLSRVEVVNGRLERVIY